MRLKIGLFALVFLLIWTVKGYAASYAFIPSNNSISIIDLTKNEVIKNIPIAEAGVIRGVAVNSNKNEIYMTATLGGDNFNFFILNTANDSINKIKIPVEANVANSVAVNPDGKSMYIVYSNDPAFWITDITDKSNLKKVALEGKPSAVTVSPDGRYIYITGFKLGLGGSLFIIDTQANNNVKTIKVDNQQPQGVATDGKFIYTANRESNTVSIVTLSNDNVDTVNVGKYPRGIAVSPDGEFVYVTNSGDEVDNGQGVMVGTVSKIKVKDKSIQTIKVGKEPRGIAVHPEGKFVYVMNTQDEIDDGKGNKVGTVSVIDTTTQMVVKTIPVGNQPNAIGNFIGSGFTVEPSPVNPPSGGGSGCALQPFEMSRVLFFAPWIGVLAILSLRRARRAG